MSNEPSQSRPRALPTSKAAVFRALSRPSWLYPFKGIYYFARNRYLWPLLRGRLIPCLVLSTIVFTTLFIWAYIPQVILLLPFHGRAAFFNGVILVLGEGATITALIFEAILADDTQAQIFDSVLIARGYEHLVANGREVLSASDDASDLVHSPPCGSAKDSAKGPANGPAKGPSHTSTYGSASHSASGSAINATNRPADSHGQQTQLNPYQRLSTPTFAAIYAPFSFKQIAEFILLLPLNLAPYVGVPAFLLLTGARAGPLHHYRYFRLRGLTLKQRRAESKRRRLRYTWFGAVALVLQLVPGLSMLFLLTTAAGSALWVADLEDEKGGKSGQASARQASSRTAVDRAEGVYTAIEEDPLLERGDAV